jgi:hypothetical protein
MAASSERINCVGPVSVCLDGPGVGTLVVKVYDAAGRFMLETRVPPSLVDAALLLRALQCPPIGLN